jgi:putative Ca2+/H+ antiporter (TMEM165/GDT1 family)
MNECGDKSQISTVLLASVYNFYGVLLGTTSALLISTLIVVCFGNCLSRYLSEKLMNYVGGFIFLIYGLEILFTKI